MKRLDNKNKSGFTLIEALVATAIIGIAIAALLVSNVSHSQANAYGMNTSTAEFLIEEIRAMTTPLDVVDPNTGTATFGIESGESSLADYDDLDDFDDLTFSPPVNVNGTILNDFSQYSQIITVVNVDAGDFTSVIADHGSSIVRVSVSIVMNGKEISSTSWIRAEI